MNLKTSFPLLIIFLVATLFGTTQPSSAIAPDQGPSAFGQGEFSFFNPFRVRGERWTYSFEAFANKNGQARGRAIFDIRANGIQTQVVVKIRCMDVSGTAELLSARIMGTVLHSDDPEFPKRANVGFAAVDRSGGPDIITRAFPFSEADCDNIPFPLTFFNQPPDAIHIEP